MWSAGFTISTTSFQECSQVREAIVKDETRRPLWATCTSGKTPPPSVYQKEFQDQLMPGQLLKGALGLEKKKMSDTGRTPYSESKQPRGGCGVLATRSPNWQHRIEPR